MIIVTPGQSQDIEIKLDTSQQNQIRNSQGQEIAPYEINLIHELEKKYGQDITRRSNPTPIYNCHGMTFACRRTGIHDSKEIYKIIADDKYEVVEPDDVLPGDIILYFDDDGDIEHSGIVLTVPNEKLLKIPTICSKWGKYAEIIHFANKSPYNFSNAKYFRAKL